MLYLSIVRIFVLSFLLQIPLLAYSSNEKGNGRLLPGSESEGKLDFKNRNGKVTTKSAQRDFCKETRAAIKATQKIIAKRGLVDPLNSMKLTQINELLQELCEVDSESFLLDELVDRGEIIWFESLEGSSVELKDIPRTLLTEVVVKVDPKERRIHFNPVNASKLMEAAGGRALLRVILVHAVFSMHGIDLEEPGTFDVSEKLWIEWLEDLRESATIHINTDIQA